MVTMNGSIAAPRVSAPYDSSNGGEAAAAGIGVGAVGWLPGCGEWRAAEGVAEPSSPGSRDRSDPSETLSDR
jgi:hypothetical protein